MRCDVMIWYAMLAWIYYSRVYLLFVMAATMMMMMFALISSISSNQHNFVCIFCEKKRINAPTFNGFGCIDHHAKQKIALIRSDQIRCNFQWNIIGYISIIRAEQQQSAHPKLLFSLLFIRLIEIQSSIRLAVVVCRGKWCKLAANAKPPTSDQRQLVGFCLIS